MFVQIVSKEIRSMAQYTIKDLETLSGIKAHTIRIWEKRYQIVSPQRTDTNIRYYDDEDLKRILNVAFLNKNGLKISKIAHASDEEIRKQIESFTNKEIEAPSSAIDSLIVAMIELDEKKFNSVFESLHGQLGFEKVIIELIYPFLERIGVLWQVGTINPAQEHFISNLIRQKIIVAIDKQKVTEGTAKRFVLFLREGELHELGLLFFYYLLRNRGFDAVYLGQNVPFADLVRVIEIHKADYLVTSVTIDQPKNDLQKAISRLESDFPNVHFIWSGYQFSQNPCDFRENSVLTPRVDDFIHLIESL